MKKSSVQESNEATVQVGITQEEGEQVTLAPMPLHGYGPEAVRVRVDGIYYGIVHNSITTNAGWHWVRGNDHKSGLPTRTVAIQSLRAFVERQAGEPTTGDETPKQTEVER